MSIPASVRSACFTKHMGFEYKGLCYCCGIQEITRDNFHCGHIIARVLGGSIHLDNLRPVCSSCNLSMGSSHMLDYATAHGFKGRITTEPRLTISQLPEEKKASTALCRGCNKVKTVAYLSRQNGYCEGCFLVLLSVPKETLSLSIPVLGDPELVRCCSCGALNSIVRRKA